jgi:hypothetical protein
MNVISTLGVACDDYAAMVITDGTKTYSTPSVKVSNDSRGRAGLWLFQVGERQEYDNFELSPTPFVSLKVEADGNTHRRVTDEFKAPNVPSPQDWVLVLERANR